jgi:hypothetical protein
MGRPSLSYFSGLFYDTSSIEITQHQMIDELERLWKEIVMAYLRHYPGICLEGLRKKTKNLTQDSRCLG